MQDDDAFNFLHLGIDAMSYELVCEALTHLYHEAPGRRREIEAVLHATPFRLVAS